MRLRFGFAVSAAFAVVLACSHPYDATENAAEEPDASTPADPIVNLPKDDGAAPNEGDAGNADTGSLDAGDADTGPFDAGPLGTWSPLAFTVENHLGTCTGQKYVAYSYRYAVWVGVRLCSPVRYKIYLAKTMTGTYYEVGDGAGSGEDQCEFVSPGFTSTVGGSITSGNCPTCNIESDPFKTFSDAGVFTRSQVGEAPVFHASWPSNFYSAKWWECAVSIP